MALSLLSKRQKCWEIFKWLTRTRQPNNWTQLKDLARIYTQRKLHAHCLLRNVCIETQLNPLVHDHIISVAVLQTERQVIRIATLQLQITGSHQTLNAHDGRVWGLIVIYITNCALLVVPWCKRNRMAPEIFRLTCHQPHDLSVEVPKTTK